MVFSTNLKGNTPLHIAIRSSHIIMIKLLCEIKSNFDHEDIVNLFIFDKFKFLSQIFLK
jgi:ankyrin repeat protein